MLAELKSAVEDLIAEKTEIRSTIIADRSASGGCIHSACSVELQDGRVFFLKSNASISVEMFEREAAGLTTLADASVLKVPGLIGTSTSSNGVAFLLIEHIETGAKSAETMHDFGARLAELHRTATAERFGFDHDNYIGSTPQSNTWNEDWCEFWREERIGYQLRLAKDQGLSTRQLEQAGEKFLQRIDDWLSQPDEPPSLLHGDLWSGNYMVDDSGAAVLIDPAVYYGRREAELAMTQLFGGFSQDFYSAYDEAWPLTDGADERIEIYTLYHLLNHLNLFGSSYLSGCLSILQKYA